MRRVIWCGACSSRALHAGSTDVPPCSSFPIQSPGIGLECQYAFAPLEIQLLISVFKNKQGRSPPILMRRTHPSQNAVKIFGFPSSSSSRRSQKTVWYRGWLSPRDLSCWIPAQLQGCDAEKPSLTPTSSALLFPKDYSENRRAKAGLKVNILEREWHPTSYYLGPMKLWQLVLKQGEVGPHLI